MLATEFEKQKQKPNTTETNVFGVSWSSSTVRFSEQLQIVDVADCFGLVYGSVGSAKTAQAKFFAPSAIEQTAAFLECDKGDILYKVKWADAARVRVATSVKHARMILGNRMGQMPMAAKLAGILDVDSLTVVSANAEAATKLNYGQVGVVEERDQCTTSSMTTAEAVQGAESRLVLQSYKSRVVADCAESNARISKADTDKHIDMVRKMECQRMASDNVVSNMKILEDERQLSMLASKIEKCDKLGMHEEVRMLKRKLIDM